MPAGALPAYNSAGTVETSATMAGTFDLAVQAHNSGDLLILQELMRNTNNNGSLDSINTASWTQLGGAGNEYGGTQNARMGGGWKPGNGSETVVNITTAGGATTDRRVGRVYCFTAANGFKATAVTAISTATTGTGTSVTMPTVNAGGQANALAVCLIAASNSTTVAAATGESGGNWTEPVAESAQTNGTIAIQVADLSGGGTISGGTATLGTSSNWVAIGFILAPADLVPTISSIEDGDTTDTRTGVAIVGTTFGASETGSAKIEVSDNATYGVGTIVEIDATGWSDTTLTATLRRESDSAALAGLFTLPLSPAYLWVTNSVGDRNVAGFQFTLRAPGPTPAAALNTNASLNVDTTYLIRVRVENSGGIGNTTFKWQANHASGGYADITAASSNVRAVAAASFVNDDDVPEVLAGSGTYASNNDAATEDGTTTLAASFPASGAIEFVLAFQLRSADVSNGQAGLIRIELGDGTDLDVYTNTFQYTVVEGAATVGMVFAPPLRRYQHMLVR